jgi:hypothetical protein
MAARLTLPVSTSPSDLRRTVLRAAADSSIGDGAEPPAMRFSDSNRRTADMGPTRRPPVGLVAAIATRETILRSNSTFGAVESPS